MTFSANELARLRAETPSCSEILHFNNAGAGLMPQPVCDAVFQHLALERDIGGYEAEARARGAIEHMYEAFAQLLHADASEIAYVENATRAWDMAFYALPLKQGDRILTHTSEYASNYLAFLQLARSRGLEIDVAPSDASGQIDVDALRRLITPKTRVIAITHVPTQGGLVNPAAEVGKVARAHDLTYLLDACQSVGQMDVNVREIGCHILSGTGRKFLRGPRGTGFLYVANQIVDQLEPPFIDLHAATWINEDTYEIAPGAKRFENWESYVAGRIGLARAVDYALDIGLAEIGTRVESLGARLRATLSDISATVHDQGVRKCGIVTFSLANKQAREIAALLKAQGCNVSVSEPSSARLDLGRRNLPPVIRASVHYYNTEEEVDRFGRIVSENA
ncbi:aminotransferase class V-fold PLP-dependent enzyme [Labrenzia sp. DG1229]|uniref:aminotransferase class V-fold PLP-dependent enzyme n=1 Tax=Labrenzia sp. DG1229 TaxID=681847 RepID=UPI00056CC054|nr:aminotransferase class V-fold PLP-dependent enzyme [Labrenzia sp. DG1229]